MKHSTGHPRLPRFIVLGALLLPLGSSAQPSGAMFSYTVRPGDNLWTLASHHLTCTCHVQALLNLNQVSDPRRLQPGSQLRIPATWLKHTPVWAHIAHLSGTVNWAPPPAPRCAP